MFICKKNRPGKKGHFPSQINLTENWYERKFETSSPAKNWEQRSSTLTLSRLDQVDPGEPSSANMKKKWLCQRSKNYVNGSASFVREPKESWLAWGRSGRWVTLVCRTIFLHINEALGGSSLLLPFNPVMSSTLQEQIGLRYQLVAITTWASKQLSIFMRFKSWG